ncbi:MAG: leucine-rich repeat domain-containing protein [Verrucomicrobiota bacterium]|jgi:hypothetical protein
MQKNIKFNLALLLAITLPAATEAQFTYTTNNGAITITEYTGPGGAVIIPSEIDALPVITIGGYFDNGFFFGAFYGCTGLASVTIPNSVTSIGDWAFYGCTGLASVTIPNSVTSIGEWAFQWCTSLISVTIPDSVTRIGEGVFADCTSLTAITVDGLNPFYSSMDGILFNKDQTTLIQCPGIKAGAYTIPNSVTSIGDWAFDYCSSLASVTIPGSVTSIGGWAFQRCTNLASVTIPNSVTSIEMGAFCACTSLTNITIPNSVTIIKYAVFAGCGLASVTIPNSVTSIEEDAFYGCMGLTNITIPNSVTNIGGWAFYGCMGLTELYFNGNAPSLGLATFSGDTNATVYYLPGTTGWGPTFGGLPTVLWNAQAQPGSFGVQTNQFGFTITGTSNLVVVVEASTNLANPAWSPLATETLTGDSFYFSDPQWTNYPARFYRLRWP